jgi:hypothetical protein
MLRGKEIPPLSAPQTLWQRPVPLEPGLSYHFRFVLSKSFSKLSLSHP